MRFLWAILLMLLMLTAVVSAQDECVGDESCYEDPPVNSEERESQPPAQPPWSGYSDGRLNPDPGEYYSIWCSFDNIHIWRVVPEPFEVTSAPLRSVIALPVGQALAIANYMSLVRNTEDTITVYGSNGNRAPEAGSKAFSLSECITRNGGAPQPLPNTQTSQNQTTVDCEQYTTLNSYLVCKRQTAGSFSEICWGWLITLCNIVPVMGVAFGAYRRRKR